MLRKISAAFYIFLFIFNLSIVLIPAEINSQQDPPNITTTLYVPDDYATVQEAVDYSGDGGTVFVKSGTYNEFVMIAKPLILSGEGIDSSVIDAAGLNMMALNIGETSGVQISGFTLQNGDSGLDISNSDNNIITNIKVVNNKVGINIWGSDSNTIKNVIVEKNEYAGISIHGGYGSDGSFKNDINSNQILDNGNGIELYESGNNNNIYFNTISNNDNGITIDGSSGNIIHHNNFTNNDHNADDTGSNQWDDGSEGNYWDDYTGTDDNNDGIGDTPYDIPGGSSQDRYPSCDISGNGKKSSGEDDGGFLPGFEIHFLIISICIIVIILRQRSYD